MAPLNFAVLYKRHRARFFFIALSLGVTAALFFHWVTGFDPDFGITNLALSIDASIATSLFMMLSDQQDAAQRVMDQRMLHLLEATHTLLQKEIEMMKSMEETDDDADKGREKS